MKDIREIVKSLTDDELIQINEEFDNETIEEDALLRRITEETTVGGKSSVTQMLGVIAHSSMELAHRLKIVNKDERYTVEEIVEVIKNQIEWTKKHPQETLGVEAEIQQRENKAEVQALHDLTSLFIHGRDSYGRTLKINKNE